MDLKEARAWMYKRKRPDGFIYREFDNGVDEFVDFCNRHPSHKDGALIRCPCFKCRNMGYKTEDEVHYHIRKFGFVPNYYCWIYHGEIEGESSQSIPHDSREPHTIDEVPNDYATRQLLDALHSGFNDQLIDEMNDPEVNIEVEVVPEPQEPNENDKRLLNLLAAGDTKAWSGSKFLTRLGATGRLLNLKSEEGLSEWCYDGICSLIDDLLPNGDNNVVKSFYETKKYIAGLGLPFEKIDVCERGCMIYRGVDADLTQCKVCETSRYKMAKQGRQPIPRKYMFYFPIKDRLKRLYLSEATALHMTWHKDHVHDTEGDMCHPCDSEAWAHFDSVNTSFAAEPRNVRLGLCTDGFQPFGCSGSQYSCWPVLVTPYNLPPGMCNKDETIFLACLVPGGANPKQRIDVYLQPLIEELIELWTIGVETYDVHRKQNFVLHAAVLWTISDFPAYAMLSGWGTAGKTACPVCMEGTVSMRLVNGGKQSWFDTHRRFLPLDHPFRSDTSSFTRGQEEHRPPLLFRTGEEVLDDIEMQGFMKIIEEGADVHNAPLCAKCGWRKRSIFWDLPYWKTNLVRHNLDVMHIEKNVFDNVFNTVMDVVGKTKDNAKSREDLKLICNRRQLERNTRTGKYPKAPYTLIKSQRKILLDWIKDVKFPDGYVSNMARCVDTRQFRMFGLKSHDCHVFMQRLIPIAFKELLPNRVWEVLTELSNFFRVLCARVISKADMKRLESDIVIIICKLECLFPPSFFDVMEHLIMHLPREARVAGPVQFRWMYPYERCLGRMKRMVKNKARVEGSICNAFLVREATIFTSHFFPKHVLTKRRKVPRNDDGGMKTFDKDMPTVFTYPGRAQGIAASRMLTDDELFAVHNYVIMNCEEIDPYIREYEQELQREHPRMAANTIAQLAIRNFTTWFKQYVTTHDIPNECIRDMAKGPLRKVRVHTMYFINGYRFHTEGRTASGGSYNSGISIYSEHGDYHGKIREIIEVEYLALPIKRCVLFKCEWFDPTLGTGTRIDVRYNLVEVNTRCRLSTTEPFILAAQATQVCYLSYPGAFGQRVEWHAVCNVRPRGWLEPKKDNQDSSAYQTDYEDICDVSAEIGVLDTILENVEQFDDDLPEGDEDEVDEPLLDTTSDENDDSSDSDYG